MEQRKALEQLKNIQGSFLEKYRRHHVLTNEIFDAITDMLSTDYASISSGGKRIRIFNQQMLSIIKNGLENDGHKNYMLDLINIFRDTVISEYLHHSFGNKADDLKHIINRLYDALFAWQGLEGCEWRRLERIEKILT